MRSPIMYSAMCAGLLISTIGHAEDTVHVNAMNFVTAQTALQLETYQKKTGGVNKVLNEREPVAIDNQPTIRMNRDTLYSFAVVDISEGATVTMPEADGRYMSLMVVNQQEYINKVFLKPGQHSLTPEEFGSDYVLLVVRTLVDDSSPADIKKVNELQDQIKIEAKSAKPFVAPNYDMASYKATLDALLDLGKGVEDTSGWFGSKEQTNPIGHLIGAAVGFGGLPGQNAHYLNVNPNLPVGEYMLTAKDVPVEAFWSISVYNAEGYFQKNPQNAYNFNSVNAKKNADGSITIHFGGCDDGRVNCLPIMEGWNYGVRMYQPGKAILDGSYTFPSVQAVTKK